LLNKLQINEIKEEEAKLYITATYDLGDYAATCCATSQIL
jgi:hypothetical protein